MVSKTRLANFQPGTAKCILSIMCLAYPIVARKNRFIRQCEAYSLGGRTVGRKNH